jgi:hypothetical protein
LHQQLGLRDDSLLRELRRAIPGACFAVLELQVIASETPPQYLDDLAKGKDSLAVAARGVIAAVVGDSKGF